MKTSKPTRKTLETTEEIHRAVRMEATRRGVRILDLTNQLLSHALRLRGVEIGGSR